MESQGATGLPASIEAAWGVRTRPGKGPRPALSLERIAAGVFDEPDDGDFDFSFGLERVLDGIETLIEKRRTGRG
jgi:hypothetical protein